MASKKSLIAALALAGAAVGAPAAFAADISHPPVTINLTDNAGFFGDVFAMNNANNTFTDQFRFTAAAGMDLSAIVSSISSTANNGMAITGFDLMNAGGVVRTGTMTQTGAVDVWTLTGGPALTSGDYWLQVKGTMDSDAAAAFGGAISMAPVPEPSTYALLLGGLGILGVAARRRRG
ncbi:MAG: FxDxF family PEP-CTERM protein [Telluria sp.]